MKRIVLILVGIILCTMVSAQNAFLSLAESYAKDQNYVEAIRLSKIALEMDKSNGRENVDYLSDLLHLIEYSYLANQTNELHEYINEGMYLIDRIRYDSDGDWWGMHVLLSSCLSKVGEYDKAIKIRQDIITKQVRDYGFTSEQVMYEYYLLSCLYDDSDNIEKAIETLYSAALIAKEIFGSDSQKNYHSINYEECMHTLIFARCLGHNRLQEAAEYAKEYSEYLRGQYGSESDRYLNMMRHLSQFFWDVDNKLLYSTICKELALYGPVSEIQYELCNILVSDENIKYDPNAQKYADRLYDVIITNTYSRVVDEDILKSKGYEFVTDIDAATALHSFYRAIEAKGKTYVIARWIYEKKCINGTNNFYDLSWLILAANDVDGTLDYVVSIVVPALESEIYSEDEKSFIRDLLSVSYREAGMTEYSLNILDNNITDMQDYGNLLSLSTTNLLAGNYEKSYELLMQMKGLKSVPESEFPNINRSHAMLAWILSKYDELDGVLPLLVNDFRASLKDFTLLTELQRGVFMKKSPYINEMWWNMIIRHDQDWNIICDTSVAYDFALLWKGVQLTSHSAFRKAVESLNDETLNEKYNRWLNLQSDYEANQVQIELLEKDMLQNLASSQAFDFDPFGKWQEVRDSLRDGEVAIEFVQSFGANGIDDSPAPFYYALVLRNDYDSPHIVKCAPYEVVSQSIEMGAALYDEPNILDPFNDNGFASLLPFFCIWEQVKPEMEGATDIYYCPIDELNNLALDCVLDIDGVHRAYDSWNIHRLSSTRELIHRDTKCLETTSVALYGGLDYNTNERLLSCNPHQETYTNKSRNIGSDTTRGEIAALRGTWSNLDWTLPEVCSIDSIIQKYPNIISKLLVGTNGTEESFYSLCDEQVNIIHFSTHGFYYDESAVDDRADEREKYRFMIFNDDPNTFVEDKSMTRCGLLLSGANISLRGQNLPAGAEDGILTAQEIATTNFKDLDLVVLSACETALGNVSGEGIYGLQRGFKKAGAKTILMSLWEVPDRPTSILMEEFYVNFLHGMDKEKALKIAQAKVKSIPRYSKAVNWAGWILLDALN